MGLSRRTFTKEFKLATVRLLEAGVSLAEVFRGPEVSPNVLHRWVREFQQAPGNAFPGRGQRRWSEGKLAELERIHLLHRLEVGTSVSASADSSSENRLALRSAADPAPRRSTSCQRPGCIHPTTLHAPAPLGESSSKASHPHSLLRTDNVLRGSSVQSLRGHRRRKGHRPVLLHLSIPRPQ